MKRTKNPTASFSRWALLKWPEARHKNFNLSGVAEGCYAIHDGFESYFSQTQPTTLSLVFNSMVVGRLNFFEFSFFGVPNIDLKRYDRVTGDTLIWGLICIKSLIQI